MSFTPDKHIFFLKEAMFYKKIENKRVECNLCPRKCKVGDMERGYCGVRENREGIYYTLVYGNPCAVHIDPIEKKPFFHFYPDSKAFSISTAGCNVNCKFCQNWQISQSRPEQTENVNLPPAEVIRYAKNNLAKSIAYTYAEPVVFYEYIIDTSKIARKDNIKSVVVSGGYIEEEPLKKLCDVVDAVKIDLKAFTSKYYKEIVNGELKPVLDTLKILKKSKIWFEIVYLVLPGLNDSEKEINDMCVWINNNLGKDVPLHFSRFYPMYKLKNLPPTPVDTLTRLRKLAMSCGIKYVYVGNVFGHEGESTYCVDCKKTLVKRTGYQILEYYIEKGRCKYCNEKIPGVWN